MMKRLWIAIALVLVCVVCAACHTDTPANTDAVTVREEETNVTETAVAATEEDELTRGYTIENGILLAYTGGETEIVLPDTVVEIAESAFAAAPEITSIRLGKNTQKIASKAFMPLKFLTTVTVDEENPYFHTDGCFLITSDYAQWMLFGTSVYNGRMKLTDVKVNDLPKEDRSFEVVLGDAVLQMLVTEDDYFTSYKDSNVYFFNLYVTGVEAYGHAVTFTPERALDGAIGGSLIFAVQDKILFTYYQGHMIVDNYIFDADGVSEMHAPETVDDTNYNTPVILLLPDPDDEQQMRFICAPAKYQYASSNTWLTYCVSWEDLLTIEGTAVFENGSIRYTPETLRTLADYEDQVEFLLRETDFGTIEDFEAQLTQNALQYTAFSLSHFEALNQP